MSRSLTLRAPSRFVTEEVANQWTHGIGFVLSLPAGWWLVRSALEKHNDWLTKSVGEGGAGYGSQWDDQFVHPIRDAVIVAADESRSMAAVADAIQHRYNTDAFQRVIYSESHDEVANGKARVPQEINPNDPTGWFAQKRSTLAAALVFTSPGIPMLFQGQEFLEGEWFRDTVPVDWHKQSEFSGIVLLYRDLVHLRLNKGGQTRGLTGQHVHLIRVDEANKVIAFRRWADGAEDASVVIVVNFHRERRDNFVIGFPHTGPWRLLFNSDWKGYSTNFSNHPSWDVTADPGEFDTLPAHAAVSIGPYSTLVYARADL